MRARQQLLAQLRVGQTVNPTVVLSPACHHLAHVQIIRGQAQKGQLPPLGEYLEAARQRLRELAGLPDSEPGGYQTT